MTNDTPPSPRPSIGFTLLALLGTVVFMTLFLGAYKILGVRAPYVGLFFLLYWAAIMHQNFAVYLPSVIGATIGILLAWLLTDLPNTMGHAGTAISYSALGVVLFCFMRGQARLVANHATLLFVLLAVIPELDVSQNVIPMLQSLFLAAGFMGVTAWLLVLVKRRGVKDDKSAAAT